MRRREAADLLLPAECERQAVKKAKGGLQPLTQIAAEVGQTVPGELQSHDPGRVEAVKGAATDAVEEVKGRTQSSVGQVRQRSPVRPRR